MQFENVYVPYGGYWSTPFVRWQGNFANLHALIFAAETAKHAMQERSIPVEVLDALFLGLTIPQKHCFYGAPWAAGLIGAAGITGPTLSQACATSARVLVSAAFEVELGARWDSSSTAVPTRGAQRTILALTCDRTSNGAHIYYPNPLGPGGMGDKEDWVWDNFGYDPYARNSMLQTAENVAKEAGITREEQDVVTLLRSSQYQQALKDDAAFLRRFMVTPIEVKDASGRKVLATVKGDEGVFPSTPEGLAKLKPVLEGGSVTYGGQTYPADGNCGLLVTSRDRARELSRDPSIEVQVLAFGQGRAKKGYMAQATVPAARQALERAGISIQDVKAIKTHNPFAVNDIYFSREMGVKLEQMNNYGCSLIWGHPQGPTGTRLIIELIEELALAGGGYGLFDGCAAGDTAAAVVIEVK